MGSTVLGRVVGCITKRAESREPRAESREPRAESREPRAESREPRAESREPRAELCPRRGSPPRPSPPSRASLFPQGHRSFLPRRGNGTRPLASALQHTCRVMRRRNRTGPDRGCTALCAPVSGWRRGPSSCSPRSLTLPPHAAAQTVTTLVSNPKQTHGASVAHVVGAVGCSPFSQAQRFTTGDNKGGDSSFSVQVRVKEYAGTDEASVRTCSPVAFDNPHNSFCRPTNRCLAVGGSLNTSNARSNATLEIGRQCFLVAGATSRSRPTGLRVNGELPD